ncbi:hypothetical protein ACJJTC_010221 [Scirpophaga incertulas]
MKHFLILFVVIAGSAASVIKDLNVGYKTGDRFFYFPGGDDGTLHLVDTQEPVDEEFIRSLARVAENNLYKLYTRSNPLDAQYLHIYDDESIANSNYNKEKETIFIAHGWNGYGRNEMNRMITEAFLRVDDVNVIVIDWSKVANKNYVTAKNGVPEVGRGVGRFINWLVECGVASYDAVHLVGFSLGGHLVGNAGRETGGRVKRITALDPAGPMWSRNSENLRSTDGQYVEVIHTNTGLLGYTDPCGDADFYPNGGTGMPGCWTNTCSHGKAPEYFASTVKYNHLHAERCGSLREAQRGRCTGDKVPMGNGDINKFERGIFHVNTAKHYPY